MVASNGKRGHGVDVLRPVVVRLDKARIKAARGVLPWPIKGAPFDVDTMASIIGVYLGGAFWGPHAVPFLRCGAVPVAFPDTVRFDGFGGLSGLLHAYAAWHTYTFDDEDDVSASPAWLARLLTIFSWTLLPSSSDAALDDPNMRLVTAARANARCAIVPGGNLHGLVVGGWAIARELATVLIELLGDEAIHRDPAVPVTGTLVPERFADALRGVAPMPAFDLGAVVFGDIAASAIDRDEFTSEYVWGRALPARAAGRVHTAYRRVIGVGDAPVRMRTFPSNRFWRDCASDNLVTYCDMSRTLIDASCWALRLVLHIVYRLYRHFDPRLAYAARPARWVPQLRMIAETDPQALSDAVYRHARDTGLPLDWLWEAERRFEATVREQAQVALCFAWGMPQSADDSLDRCCLSVPVGEVALTSPLAAVPRGGQSASRAARCRTGSPPGRRVRAPRSSRRARCGGIVRSLAGM